MSTANKIKITQTGSVIDQKENAKRTMKALGLDPATVRLHATAIPKMQDERTFKLDEPIPVKVAGGWFLIAEKP